MNKVMRGVAMSGLAVAAGLIVTAGPAAASSAAPATPQAKPKAPAAAHAQPRSRVLGFYRSAGACHSDGRRGEFRRQWTGHDCIPVRERFRRGYVLKVYYGWGRPDFHDGPHGPGGPHGGPDFHGGPHGGPDFHDGPHGPGPDHGPHGPWKKN
ncbi:hypothetical protein [Actinoplanes sp. NPDC020271]|uniref:hypothetical protein n=1 Tax=Actinoplanes sp. NPDC020271 TaxID=3363896 RepID=UPI0037A75F35